MGDSTSVSSSNRSSRGTRRASNNMKSKGHLVAYCHKSLSQPSLVNSGRLRKVVLVPVASFLLEVAALEVVRRFSKARCPVIWSGLQALQVVCYPPFKWIQRWNPCRALVKSMQVGASFIYAYEFRNYL